MHIAHTILERVLPWSHSLYLNTVQARQPCSYLYNFAQNSSKPQCEGISFLLEETMTFLCPFQTALHDSQGPVKNKHVHSIKFDTFTSFCVSSVHESKKSSME